MYMMFLCDRDSKIFIKLEKEEESHEIKIKLVKLYGIIYIRRVTLKIMFVHEQFPMVT